MLDALPDEIRFRWNYSMHKIAKQFVLISGICFLAITKNVCAVPATWTGNNPANVDDLTLGDASGNWGTSPPPDGDIATFIGTTGSLTPTINTLSISSDFGPKTIVFSAPGTNAYTFIIDAENTLSPSHLFLGDLISGGIDNSLGLQTQVFKVLQGGEIEFLPASSADIMSSGRIDYLATSNNISFPSSIIFDGATAGKSHIGLNTLPGSSAPSLLHFGLDPGASAEQSIIDSRVSSEIIFDNNATADQSTISLQSSSTLSFLGASDLANSFITADASDIVYNTSTTSSNGTILMANGSSLTLTQSMAIDRIAADDTCTIDLGAQNLTTAATHDGDTLDAIISGIGGSFTKMGSNLLYMTNSSNSYTGGTSVLAGTLQVTAASLPINNVSIANVGTLSFQDSGTFNGNITDNGVVSTVEGANVTLTGNITGTGSVAINEGSDLTLTGIGNGYSGGTSVFGTLHVAPANLPNSGSLVTYSPKGIVKFQGTGTYALPIINNGTIESIGGATLTLSGGISGNGNVVVDAGSDLTLTNAANSYAGGTSIFGTLHVNPNSLSSSGPVTVQSPSGILDFLTAGTFTGDITNNSTVKSSSSLSSVTLSGVISGTGKLSVDGTGQVILEGLNTYSGGTFINAGTLQASTRTLPVAFLQPSVTVNGTGTLHFLQTTSGEYAGDIFLSTPTSQLQVDNNATTTLSGKITGSGSVSSLSGTTTLTNTGNSYTGGTSISANATLEGPAPALQGSITNNGELIFNQSVSGTFTGAISGPSNAVITKIGIGTTTVSTPQASFLGTTYIKEGTLLINNTYGGNVNILKGGTLGGTGTILNNVVNSGTISPGNSIGTLNITGNYTQTTSGTYFVEIDGSGNTDLINILGTATLDGTLAIDLIDGVIDSSKVYTILHADGGVIDTFSTVTTTNIPFYNLHVTYLPKDVQLTLESVFISVADTYNQRQVAEQLNTINPSSATPEELNVLFNLLALSSQPATVDAARQALSEMSGEQYTNHLFTSELIGRRFVRRLYDPLRSIILNNGACCDRDVYYNCYESNGCTVLDDTPWIPNNLVVGPWIEISGGHTFFRHDNNARGFQSNNYEVTIGLQSTVTDIWTLGIAGSYAHENINYNIGGSGNINTGLLGIYGLYRPEGCYVILDLIGNYNWGKVKRPIDIGSLHYVAHSNPKFAEGMFYIEMGKDVCIPYSGLLIQPFLGFEVDFYGSKRIVERHADPINLVINKKSRTNAFSRLGIHLATTNMASWNISLDAAWQYRMTTTSNHVSEHFEDFGNTFDIKGVALPRNSLDISAYISTVINDEWELFAEISGERWSRGGSFDIVGGVKFSW